MIPFTQLPGNIRVPLFYAELDSSQASHAQISQRTLLIGQMTTAGTGTPDIPLISAGTGDAQQQWGINSMLAAMTAAYRAADGFGELWYLPLQDDPGAVAATGSLTIETAPTAAGVISLYIGGRRYQLPVLPTQTPTQIATALAALTSPPIRSRWSMSRPRTLSSRSRRLMRGWWATRSTCG